MMREGKYFQARLTQIGYKTIEGDTRTQFTLQHIAEGDVQVFLNSFAKRMNLENVSECTSHPIAWANLKFKFAIPMDISFDAYDFQARLDAIAVTRKEATSNQVEKCVYSLIFSKTPDIDLDSQIKEFLNAKEEDENGKQRFVFFDALLKPIEQD